MNRYLYPTPAMIHLVCVWADEGTAGLERLISENAPARNSVRTSPARDDLMEMMRDLVRRLDLPSEYERARQSVSGKPLNALNPALLHQLVATLRMHGYIFRTATGWHTVPLTGRQLHVLRLLARGMTRPDVARVMGVSNQSLSEFLTRLRTSMGCDTLDQALMAVVDRGWFPTHRERGRMRGAQAHHRPKGVPHSIASEISGGAS